MWMADLPKVLVMVCVTPPPSVPDKKKKKNHTNPQLTADKNRTTDKATKQ